MINEIISSTYFIWGTRSQVRSYRSHSNNPSYGMVFQPVFFIGSILEWKDWASFERNSDVTYITLQNDIAQNNYEIHKIITIIPMIKKTIIMKSLFSSKRTKAILGIGLIAIGIGAISKKVISYPTCLLYTSPSPRDDR